MMDEVCKGEASHLGLWDRRTRSLEYTEYFVSYPAVSEASGMSQLRHSYTRNDLDLGDAMRVPQDNTDL